MTDSEVDPIEETKLSSVIDFVEDLLGFELNESQVQMLKTLM